MTDRLPLDSLEIPRFCGAPTFMRMEQTKILNGVDVAVFGIPSDAGSPFRTGARFGPGAVRSMSIMLRPINPYQDGINVFEACKVIDYGDAPIVPGYIEESFQRTENEMGPLLSNGIIPVGIGGDHSVSLPQLRSIARARGPVGLLHFDSHTDTWDSYFAGKKYSAGTPFKRAVEERLILPEHTLQVGMRGSLFTPDDIEGSRRLGFEVITTDEMFQLGISALADRIVQKMSGKEVFISFDMDFVDPGCAPGVQTPEAGGPSARESLDLIRRLRGLEIAGCDVVEVNPLYDNPGQITALLAATVAAEFLALIAYRKSKKETAV